MDPDASSRPALDRQLLDELVGVPGWRVEVLDEAPSTNAVLAERARAGATEGLVVVAEHQSAGRGRLARSWVTPPRTALTFSVLLRPRVAERLWTWVPPLAGLAVVDGVEAAGGPRCVLKWPNDVLYDERKLAGLLAEVVTTRDGPAVVAGIGLNVGMRAEELPVSTATSLALIGHPVPDRTGLLVAVLQRLAAGYESWQRYPSRLREEYAAACGTLGRRVAVELPSGDRITGTAVDVDVDGALVVEVAGRRTTVGAGDVVHLRTSV